MKLFVHLFGKIVNNFFKQFHNTCVLRLLKLHSNNCFQRRIAYPSPRWLADTPCAIVSCCVINAMRYIYLANYNISFLANVDFVFGPEQKWIRNNLKGEAPVTQQHQNCRNCCVNFCLHWCLGQPRGCFSAVQVTWITLLYFNDVT